MHPPPRPRHRPTIQLGDQKSGTSNHNPRQPSTTRMTYNPHNPIAIWNPIAIPAQFMHETAGEYRTRTGHREATYVTAVPTQTRQNHREKAHCMSLTTQGRYTTQSKGQVVFRPAKDKTQLINSEDRNPSTVPSNQNQLKAATTFTFTQNSILLDQQ